MVTGAMLSSSREGSLTVLEDVVMAIPPTHLPLAQYCL
jgi:hypothetical protein